MCIQIDYVPTCDGCGKVLDDPDEILCEKCKNPNRPKCRHCDDRGYYETLIGTLADCPRCDRPKAYE